MNILCAVIFACLSLQARLDPPAISAWSNDYNEHSTLIEYVAAIEYNEHSTLSEYVAATSYVENHTYTAALSARAGKPIERYWMEDPVDAPASIAAYDVGTVRPIRLAAMPMGINSAETVLHVYGDVHSTAAIPAAAVKPAEGDSFGTGMSFSIDRGWGFKVPDTIVHHVQAKDWW